MLLIPGTTSVAHLEENLAAAEIAFEIEDRATLATVRQAGNVLSQIQPPTHAQTPSDRPPELADHAGWQPTN